MRIVVLGGEGMLGHKMFLRLWSTAWPTECTIRGLASNSPLLALEPGVRPAIIEGVDATDFAVVERVLKARTPDWVINCIGVIKQRDAARAAIPVITLNSLLPHRLAELCRRWGGRLIHFSTDCVFSGSTGGYAETDFADATDLYGRSKLLGEVMKENALTLRTSIVGRELRAHRSLLDWFLSNEGGTVSGYTRVMYSGVTTNHLADLVALIVERRPELNGLYHVAGPPISKHDLLCLFREAYQANISIVPDSSLVSDKTMTCARIRAEIGYEPPAWPQLVAALAGDPTPYARYINNAEATRR